MWRDPRFIEYLCPYCNTNLQIVLNYSECILKCDKCDKIQELIRCPKKNCKVDIWVCSCRKSREFLARLKKNTKLELKNTSTTNSTTPFALVAGIVAFAAVLFVAFFLYLGDDSKSYQDDSVNLIETLKRDFPSQKNETWFHFLSVLEKKIPSVKSITFLHSADKRTPNCLTNKLVSLFSGSKNIKSEEITFSAAGYEGMDYGFALEHYRLIVQKFRVFVTDLTEVPGNIARIFHSLCDEVSSDIKPSLFIFTLKFDEKTEKLKPMKRAVTILKETWSDLPDNEIFPLLSRIIKNVVDVVPEKKASC